MRHRLTLVLFDCDGTLLDSRHEIAAAMRAAFLADARPPPPSAAVGRVVGLSLPHAVASLAPAASAADCQRLASLYTQAFADNRAAGRPHGTLFPGAAEAVTRLSRSGHVLGIVTGKSRRGLGRFLDGFGLRSYFDTLQTADDAPGKPHPAMVERAMADTGAAPESTVVVGDTTFDIEMAIAAGAAAVGVRWGHHDAAELASAGARTVIGSFDDVERAVAGVLDL